MALTATVLQKQFYWIRATKKNVVPEKLGSTRYVAESGKLVAPSC
jgi:hypothetical protein